MMVLPGTLDQLTHTIQVLQQLQRLLPIEATLSDVADLLICVETEFGPDALLEDVIQHFVGKHLAAQLELKATARLHAQMQVKLEVVA